MESQHNNKKVKQIYNLSVSKKFQEQLPKGDYEIAFRRWLVREINDKNMSRSEALATFNFNPDTGRSLLGNWVQKYSDEFELPLASMSPEEKAQKQADAKRIKELEKKLELSTIHVKALNTLIDIAEEQLKISIRKKSGTKQ